jgi:tetratricopeptide (TPR) repeat protein
VRKAEALADYAAAISADPGYALAYANRGHYYAEISKAEEALKDLARAIELDPANPEPWYTRAMVYRSQREFAKAIPDLNKYIALTPSNPRYLADGYLNRGIAHASTGNLDLAMQDISKAIEAAPDYADAYKARATVYRLMKKNDLAEADEQKARSLLKPH